MYYFAYCTWLDPKEMDRYWPEAKFVTKGYVANHSIAFHAASDRADRGWCHLDDTPSAHGKTALGVVFEHENERYEEDYDDFERVSFTVYGDDGRMYDCWTYVLTSPGIAMRPPNFYWEHIPAGLKHFEFPEEYVQKVLDIYHAAAECPRADRPNPSAIPGKSADSR